MNDLARALSELGERGAQRGADRVLADARSHHALKRSRSSRRPVKLAVAAAIAVGVLAIGVGLRNRGRTTSVTSGTGARATRSYVVPGALPFKPTDVSFDETHARGVPIEAPRLLVFARRSSDGSRVTAAVGAETTIGRQTSPLAVQPLDPKGRHISLSPRVTATLTRPGFGRSGLTLLTWKSAPSRRIRVAGRGLSEDALVRFAQSIFRPNGEIKLDQSRAPVGLSLLYDGPDLASEPSGRILWLTGSKRFVEIFTSQTKFSPLAGLWPEALSRLVHIRGHVGLLHTGEQLSSLSWAETDDLAVSVTVQNRLSNDLLSIASRLRVVDAAGWNTYLHHANAKPPQSVSATTTAP